MGVLLLLVGGPVIPAWVERMVELSLHSNPRGKQTDAVEEKYNDKHMYLHNIDKWYEMDD